MYYKKSFLCPAHGRLNFFFVQLFIVFKCCLIKTSRMSAKRLNKNENYYSITRSAVREVGVSFFYVVSSC